MFLLRSGVVERQRRATVWSSGKDARLLLVRRRFESCRRSHFVGGRCPWRHGSLISSRSWSIPAPPTCSRFAKQDTARGLTPAFWTCSCTTSACRGAGHPAGFGSRRPLVRFQPGRLRGRGDGCPREPHELETAGSNPARAIASLRSLHGGNQFPPCAPFWFVLAADGITAARNKFRSATAQRDTARGLTPGVGGTDAVVV